MRGSTFTLLRSALARAVDLGQIRSNPTDKVERPTLERQEKIRALSPDDVAEILRTLSGHETWLPATLMAVTGMRRGEVAALRRSSIDLDRGEIHVQGTVQRVAGKLRVGPPKTKNSERSIAITPELVAVLRDHLSAQERIGASRGWCPRRTWFLPQAPKGPWNPTVPRSPSALREAARWLLQGTKFADWSPHDFRHSHATALLRAGVNPKAVAARLGDTVATVMSTYAHLLSGDAEAVATLSFHAGSSKKWQGRFTGRSWQSAISC